MQTILSCSGRLVRNPIKRYYLLSHRLLHKLPSSPRDAYRISGGQRTYAASARTRTADAKSSPATDPEAAFYVGPLSKTFRSLKTFSLSSLALCTSVSPFIYLMDSNLSHSARLGLIVFALSTSSLSTALIGWISSPYVGFMRNIESNSPSTAATDESHKATTVLPGAVELVTRNTWLMERRTRVYDPIFLGQTKRPFAKWELKPAAEFTVTEGGVRRQAGETEVVAETLDGKGKVLGQLVAHWTKMEGAPADALVGLIEQRGSVVRYFNVHEELLK
ncbi:hypothetical protein FRB95_008579 [Tulasnella sp. JGI-2019a]|nr:hypothetical protein FRB95_008579 [Tulasnella sp. JGI-2019a]